MSAIAAAIGALRAKGMSDSDILDVVAAMAAAPANVDVQAERRRAKDRERKAAARLRNSADSAEVRGQNGSDLPPPVSPLSPSPKPLTQNPPLSPTNPPADAGVSALDGEFILPIAKPKPPPNASRGCRLPPGFPGDDEREWTRQHLRFTDDDFEQCRDEFRDYWSGVPGSRGVKCDWPATFRNAARKYRPGGGPRQAHSAGNQRSDGSLLGAYQRGAARVRAQNDVSRQRTGVFDHGERELEMRYGIPAE